MQLGAAAIIRLVVCGICICDSAQRAGHDVRTGLLEPSPAPRFDFALKSSNDLPAVNRGLTKGQAQGLRSGSVPTLE